MNSTLDVASKIIDIKNKLKDECIIKSLHVDEYDEQTTTKVVFDLGSNNAAIIQLLFSYFGENYTQSYKFIQQNELLEVKLEFFGNSFIAVFTEMTDGIIHDYIQSKMTLDQMPLY